MLKDKDSMNPVIVDFGLATPADIEKYLFFRCGTGTVPRTSTQLDGGR